MAEIWFYKPHDLVGRVVATMTRGKYSHVSVLHSVADLAVVTESHQSKGVLCTPVSRVRLPDVRVHVNIDDAWITRWLVSRWGVKYGWLDALAFAVPSFNRELDKVGVICTELVGAMILDAAVDPASKSLIPFPWEVQLRASTLAKLSPSRLADILL